jgi:hypothetical protein
MGIFDNSEVSTEQLRKRLFLYLSTALLSLLLGLSITILFALFNQLKKAESHSLDHMAEIRSMAVSEWCRRAKDIAKQITSRTRIRQELEKYNKGKITLQQLDYFTKPKLQDAMNRSNEVLGIIRLDAKNQIVTHCGFGSDLSLNSQNIMDYVSDNVTVSEPIIIKNRSLIIVSAPILNRIGENQGTDLVLIDIELLKKIVTNPEELGKTSEIIVGYTFGNSILPVFPIKRRGVNYSNVAQRCILKAIEGRTGLIHAAGIAVAYRPIVESGWGLAITQNDNELYSLLYKKIVIIGCIFFLIYFFILFGFWFIMKPLAGRILLHTDELEKRIQEKTEILEKEIVERKKAEKEKEKIIAELQEMMAKIKTLSGMLPICSHCKKIRDDKGYWSQIESYIRNHSEAEFSHSICPECAKKLYPDLNIYGD